MALAIDPLRIFAALRPCRAKICGAEGFQADEFAERARRAVFIGSAQSADDSMALATAAAAAADNIDEAGTDTSVTPSPGAQAAIRELSAESINGR